MCPATGLPVGERPRDRRAAIPGAGKPRVKIRKPEELIGQVVEGKYRVWGIIGQGGMGTVYEAEHTSAGHRVALKVLKADQVQKKESVSRFEHEARVLGGIRHPSICQIYDVGRLEDGSPFMVMERLQGESLADRLERAGAVGAQELCGIMVEALGALEAAHQQGIVHRDFKPDNIFLSERSGVRQVKVLDFGISKATGLEDAEGSLTRTGMVMGTPYYMAPEQAMGERNLDARVDVWAAGVVMYEALSGQRPFVARNYNALLVHILTSSPRQLGELAPGVPGAVLEVVKRALDKKRETRFQSAREVRVALGGVEWPVAATSRLQEGRSGSAGEVSSRGISRGSLIGFDKTVRIEPQPVRQEVARAASRPVTPQMAPQPTDPPRSAGTRPSLLREAVPGRLPEARASERGIHQAPTAGPALSRSVPSAPPRPSSSPPRRDEGREQREREWQLRQQAIEAHASARKSRPPEDGDEEPTVVLMREEEETTLEDNDQTEVDPPSFLGDSAESNSALTERRRK